MAVVLLRKQVRLCEDYVIFFLCLDVSCCLEEWNGIQGIDYLKRNFEFWSGDGNGVTG